MSFLVGQLRKAFLSVLSRGARLGWLGHSSQEVRYRGHELAIGCAMFLQQLRGAYDQARANERETERWRGKAQVSLGT